MTSVSDHIKAQRAILARASGLDELVRIRRDTPNDTLLAHEIDEKIESECQAGLGACKTRKEFVRIYEAAPIGCAARRAIYRALVAFDEKNISVERSLANLKSYLDLKYLEPMLIDALRLRIAAHAGKPDGVSLALAPS